MQMYIFTGPTPDRSSGLDQDVLLHELTHGTSNRLHDNAAGLIDHHGRRHGRRLVGLLRARAAVHAPTRTSNGIYTHRRLGHATRVAPGYTDNYYYGIRRFPYAVKTHRRRRTAGRTTR